MVDALFELFDRYGKLDYIGEEVSQVEHALQCARLAELDNFPANVVLGAFLHDIGHLLGEKLNSEPMILNNVNYGTKNHDKLGADYLRSLKVPENVCMFVENHVIAKRYLVFKVSIRLHF
jgi:putative nucleotidyltransferase with HDIG domain